MLQIQNVHKAFGRLQAVNNLSLEVPAGSVHAVLGPNGAGKTTTIKMCIGLLQPDAGTITVAGYDAVKDGTAAREHLAYVPDEPYLYMRLTGREFLQFIGRVYKLGPELFQQRFDEAVQLFHLDEFIDHLADGYSHGMRQRVVLAAALMHDPDLMIVDEPLVGLDPKHIRLVLKLLRQRADQGKAVLMSSHTLSAVNAIADTVSVIDHGQLLYSGPVAELAEQGDLEEWFLQLTEGDEEEALQEQQVS
jgi:ABC-2 type transport system ATP-binding protein